MLPALKFLRRPRVPTDILSGWKARQEGIGASNAQRSRSSLPWVCNAAALLLLLLPKRSQTRRPLIKTRELSDFWT